MKWSNKIKGILYLTLIQVFLYSIGSYIPADAQDRTPRPGDKSWNVNKITFPSYQSLTRTEYSFPDLKGYVVLTCDFHTHTVFSDGLVWPSLRVAEAWTEGIDVLAITDHIEYRPHKQYISGDHNTSYNIAKEAADKVSMILIKGSEITRKQQTLGHYNALFLNDSNPLETEEPKEAVLQAKKQNAFVIWNHPGWAVDSTVINPLAGELLKEGLIGGIEVYNNSEFYPVALKWAIEKNLAIIAATDVHANVEKGVLDKEGVIRPMTLVLAKERSPEGVREALDAGRTVAVFQNYIAAREDIARWLVEEYLSLKKIYSSEKTDFYSIRNFSSLLFRFTVNGKSYEIPGLSTITLTSPKGVSLSGTVFNNIFTNLDKTLAYDLQPE